MTSDERSWKFDRPVIFLGEWCRHHDRKHIWSKMDAIVAEPYAIKPEEKEMGRELVVSLYNDIINELAIAMNQVHGTNHSTRYWNILLGPWLNIYIKMIINRYGALETVLNNYEISGVSVIEPDSYQLPVKSFLDFLLCLDDGSWNLALYSKILEYKGYYGLNVDYITGESTSFPCRNTSEKGVKPMLVSFLRKILSLFSRQDDAFIIRSYLSFKSEVLLQIMLGQVPQLWKSPELIDVPVDSSIRSKFSVSYVDHSDIYLYSRKLISEIVPVCYLEGYRQLVKKVKELDWPQNPKFIFTSNSFFLDEVFKVWTGMMVEKKVPYYTGQHGANYGTLYGFNIWTEFSTCDKFFSWGWELPLSTTEVIPAFNLKVANKKKRKSTTNDGLLLIERSPGRRDGPHDRYYEHILYQDYVFQFFRALPGAIQNKTLVRLHHGSSELCASDENLWKEKFPHIQIDLGFSSINKLISKNRLIVHAYESAGILETLALNIPTIAFWREGFDHIIPSARPYYELLVSVGIIAKSPEEAADHIEKYWDDIDKWWYSDSVQEVRKTFCDQYSRIIDHPIWTLKNLLTS